MKEEKSIELYKSSRVYRSFPTTVWLVYWFANNLSTMSRGRKDIVNDRGE